MNITIEKPNYKGFETFEGYLSALNQYEEEIQEAERIKHENAKEAAKTSALDWFVKEFPVLVKMLDNCTKIQWEICPVNEYEVYFLIRQNARNSHFYSLRFIYSLDDFSWRSGTGFVNEIDEEELIKGVAQSISIVRNG